MRAKHFTILLLEPTQGNKYQVKLFATSSTEAIINSIRKLTMELHTERLELLGCTET